MKLRNLTHTQEMHQAIEAEHEYEVLDKYNQEYAEMKFHIDVAENKKLNTSPEAYIHPITVSKISA